MEYKDAGEMLAAMDSFILVGYVNDDLVIKVHEDTTIEEGIGMIEVAKFTVISDICGDGPTQH